MCSKQGSVHQVAGVKNARYEHQDAWKLPEPPPDPVVPVAVPLVVQLWRWTAGCTVLFGSIGARSRRSEVNVGWSGCGRRIRWGACTAVFMLLAAAGCAPSTAGAQPVPGAACGSAPGPSAGSALPFGLIDVSAVPATRQAWALAGRPAGRFTAPERGNYLLHFSGLNWTKVITFRRDIELKGVSAVSATAAWVWGDQGRGEYWPSYRPYLALVSGGAVRPMRAALLSGVYVASIASDGTADTWLAGGARDLQGRFRGRWWRGGMAPRGIGSRCWREPGRYGPGAPRGRRRHGRWSPGASQLTHGWCAGTA